MRPEIRRVGPAEIDAAVETLWLAFGEDPLWRWAFPDHARMLPLWHLYVTSAVQHEWVWTLDDHAAVAVWIPPGRTELTPEEQALLPELMGELAGERAAELVGLFERFEDTHPHEPPHYYLTLLGTRPDRRGQGVGMRLLRANLGLIDTEGAGAYLESSNPANVARYEAAGFTPHGSFTTPDGRREVMTMWREPAQGA